MGERDSGVLANLAKGRSRARIPELIDALHESFGEHHAFLCGQHLRPLDELTALLDGGAVPRPGQLVARRRPRPSPAFGRAREGIFESQVRL